MALAGGEGASQSRRTSQACVIATDAPFAGNVERKLRNLLARLPCTRRDLQSLYRARFFGHKFDLSGVVHGGLLPGETRLTRAA